MALDNRHIGWFESLGTQRQTLSALARIVIEELSGRRSKGLAKLVDNPKTNQAALSVPEAMAGRVGYP